jgi:tetratricopeptide (TPR) repeat protein
MHATNHCGRLGAARWCGRLFVAAFAAVALTCQVGCTSLRRKNALAESVGQCRQLSREGVAAMEHGDSARARLLLQQAVAAGPHDVDARRQLAEVLWREGAATDAVDHIQKAVELDPNHAPTVVRSGEMLLGLGDIPRAEQRAEEALALDATLPGAWALRGRVFRQRGEGERALADFHQSLRYNPHAADVLLEAAQIQYELGRPQRCLTTLQALEETYTPGHEPRSVLWLEGLALAAVNRKQDAVDALYAASTRGAPEPELLYQLAQAQNEIGQVAAATASARQAADAGHVGGRSLLAQIQAAAGETILR